MGQTLFLDQAPIQSCAAIELGVNLQPMKLSTLAALAFVLVSLLPATFTKAAEQAEVRDDLGCAKSAGSRR